MTATTENLTAPNGTPWDARVEYMHGMTATEYETRLRAVDNTLSTAPAPYQPTVNILTALDRALSGIQARNPNVPRALAVVIATGKGKVHGHFAPGSWEDTAGEHAGSARHEILMASESLARGAEATLTTLIHEAGHALAHATGVKDTSRQGRYHNEKFQETVVAMGLTVEKNSSIGYVTTGLNSWAREEYEEELALLETVLISHRKSDKAKAPAKKTTIRVACACEFPVTVPIKWFDDFGYDNMRCNLCIDSGDTGTFEPFEN